MCHPEIDTSQFSWFAVDLHLRRGAMFAVLSTTIAYAPGLASRHGAVMSTAASSAVRDDRTCIMTTSLERPARLVGMETLAQRVEAPSCGALLSRFSRLFRGHFDNFEQADADLAAGSGPREGGGHEHIHCHLQPLPDLSRERESQELMPRSKYVLASYYADGQPEKLFRERIYALSACDADAQFGQCIQMQIFRLREDTVENLRSVGGDASRVLWDVDDADESLLIPDCNVYWRWLGERFEGEMRTESIVVHSPVLKRDIVVRDDVALWEGSDGAEGDALWCNDRGSDMEGNYVYGNIHDIPYKMQRVDAEHWTATGAPRPS